MTGLRVSVLLCCLALGSAQSRWEYGKDASTGNPFVAMAAPAPAPAKLPAPAAGVACPLIYAPLCDTSNVTHANKCIADASNATIACEGECPCARAPAAAPAGPCACTADGVSGGASTSAPGCGQWLVSSEASAAFVCFVNNPATCPEAATLTPSRQFPGAAYRSCPPDTAQLPTMAALLRGTPRLGAFFRALKAANVTRVPGDQITVFAPDDDALAAAISSGQLADADLDDPVPAGRLVSAAVVSQRLPLASLRFASSVQNVAGGALPVTTKAGNVSVGGSPVALADVLASDGVLHIVSRPLGLQQPAAAAPKAESVPSVAAPVPAPKPAPVLPPPKPISSPPPPPPKPAPPPPKPAPPPPPTPVAIPPALPVPVASVVAPPVVPLLQPQAFPGLPEIAQPTVPTNLYGPASPFAGCECSETGLSGGVQTGQAGCASRVGEQLGIAFSFCYTTSALCALATPSIDHPGAAWRLCP